MQNNQSIFLVIGRLINVIDELSGNVKFLRNNLRKHLLRNLANYLKNTFQLPNTFRTILEFQILEIFCKLLEFLFTFVMLYLPKGVSQPVLWKKIY